MTKSMSCAAQLAALRPSLILHPDDMIGKSDFLNPKSHSGAAAIIKDGTLVGILTERDLLKRVLAKGLSPETTTVKQIMTPHPVSISAEAPLKETLTIIVDSGYRFLPVLNKGTFIGMIDVRDLYAEIQHLMKEAIDQERKTFANMMAEPYGMDTFSTNVENIWI